MGHTAPVPQRGHRSPKELGGGGAGRGRGGAGASRREGFAAALAVPLAVPVSHHAAEGSAHPRGGGRSSWRKRFWGVCVKGSPRTRAPPPALSKLAAARVQPCAQPAGGARLHTRVQATPCPRGCPKGLRGGEDPSPGLWGRAPRRLRGLLFWCLRRVSRAPSAPALPCPASRHPQQGRLQDVGSPGAPLQPLCWPGV